MASPPFKHELGVSGGRAKVPPRPVLAIELEEARANLARLERMAAAATCAEIGCLLDCAGGANCGCPDGACSVPVNTCTRCGDSDYGENEEAREVRRACAERRNDPLRFDGG